MPAPARRRAEDPVWQAIRRCVLDRDGGVCRWCGGRGWLVDHVVPLSRGGDDTAANKRAAHLGCNIRRGAGGGAEQLALVG